jgi:transposase
MRSPSLVAGIIADPFIMARMRFLPNESVVDSSRRPAQLPPVKPVERLFNKLRHFRKVTTRCEKSARNFLAAALIVCSHLWMRFYESAI